MAARKIIHNLPGRPFSILIASSSVSTINLARLGKATIPGPPTFNIIHHKDNDQRFYPFARLLVDLINVVYHKPVPDHLEQIHEREIFQK